METVNKLLVAYLMPCYHALAHLLIGAPLFCYGAPNSRHIHRGKCEKMDVHFKVFSFTI